MIMILSFYDLFDKYYIFFYTLQRYLSHFLFILGNKQSLLLLVFLFMLGVVTVFNPCFVSILPLALSYLNSKKSYSLNIGLFIFGLLTSFITLIILTNFLGLSFFIYKLPIFSYLILIIVSLDLMKIINLAKLNTFFSLNSSVYLIQNTILQSYFMGLIIGLSSLPCNTSLLIMVTFLLHNVNNFFIVLLDFFVYLIGCIIPLLLILKIKLNNQSFSVIFFIWKSIFPLSGSFLFMFSCFSFLKIIFI
uniref:thiol:disulfide interchange protein n=1 Tax=Lophurella stichidiosa TaxID=2008659 RepID=UPI002551DDB0|nr:thiol:disulfide interchange protein [Aphanocladia stichidiosa]WGH13952.1 thiol:disulfide interchange protein [Aphanocladia stichidiosa]